MKLGDTNGKCFYYHAEVKAFVEDVKDTKRTASQSERKLASFLPKVRPMVQKQWWNVLYWWYIAAQLKIRKKHCKGWLFLGSHQRKLAIRNLAANLFAKIRNL